MDIENNIRSTVTDFGIWVGGHVIKELMNSFFGLLCELRLVCHNFAACHEDSTIHGPGVEQEAPNHLLNVIVSIFIQFGTVVY